MGKVLFTRWEMYGSHSFPCPCWKELSLYKLRPAYFFNCKFILFTSTFVPYIDLFVVITRPLQQLLVRKRSSSISYMIEKYNTLLQFLTMSSNILNNIL